MTDGERQDEEFEQVFRALLPRARHVAFRVLQDGTDAEDAAAEAFARAHASWRRVGQLPYRDAWILRVASNVAIDMVRKRRPLALAMERAQQEDDAELRILLVDALRTLPRRQREVVALRFLHGFSEVDVAQVLRVSPGTVKKTTHRAMEALRQKLGSAFDPATMTTTEETSDAF